MKETRVMSNYFQKIDLFVNCEKKIKSYVLSWGNQVISKNEIHHFIPCGNTEELIMLKDVDKYINSKNFHNIQDIFTIHIKKINNLKVDIIFQYTFDYSRRYLNKTINLELSEYKSIIIITLKYIKNKNVLMTDSYSEQIDTFKLKKFENYLEKNYLRVLEFLDYKDIQDRFNFMYLCLSPFTASVLAHEIFGHLFEIDNFNNLNIDKAKIKIPNFISVIDSPLTNLSGYCSFDDYGNILSDLTIIKNGFICNLIGNNTILYNSSRIRGGETACIPRVTNTIVKVNKEGFIYLNNFSNYILLMIQGITKAKLYDDIILIYADSCYIMQENKKYKTYPMIISLKVLNFFENIIGFFDNNFEGSSIECIKKGQRCGGVGFLSPGMVINIKKADFQFCRS